MNDHERWIALQQVLQCDICDGTLCTAYEVWTAWRHLTLSQVIQIAEGICKPDYDNDTYCAFCVLNAIRYFTARRYHVKDVIYTRHELYVAYLVCYRDNPLCVSVFPCLMLYFGYIKLSKHECYFYNTEYVYPE